ncbi:hypothetical protein E2C01_064552 [Portunus trituberculatus]|uniref:Uncharacterized protein n=1 Tax=Portunus trituberculatus TaxID=210409 RepID=A0A5B7HM52_PORTR|nr:hypothetical protein [Portunus trituberculatus]
MNHGAGKFLILRPHCRRHRCHRRTLESRRERHPSHAVALLPSPLRQVLGRVFRDARNTSRSSRLLLEPFKLAIFLSSSLPERLQYTARPSCLPSTLIYSLPSLHL